LNGLTGGEGNHVYKFLIDEKLSKPLYDQYVKAMKSRKYKPRKKKKAGKGGKGGKKPVK
jgi:hypothetical protein